MAYRSMKRVLRAASLERKIRILFVISLAIVITIGFSLVYTIAVKLVQDKTHQTARDRAHMVLIYRHWERLERDDRWGPVQQEMRRHLLTDSFQSEILGLEPELYYFDTPLEVPEDPAEREILERLRERFEAEQAALAARDVANAVPEDIFEERKMQEEGLYNYYHPVYFKESCLRCHYPLENDEDIALSDLGTDFGNDVNSSETGAADRPFRAVKIIMPYDATQRAITWIQAVLFATAIMTIFLGMVVLYLIVNYVIVKPLAHLRDVSDEISRGNTSLRAEIQTNDEFEQLAEAFNRMLRHMTDAHAELEQVNQELDAKVDELAQLNMQLYEMNRLKDDFLANMSHELRTPLNSIIGFSEVLQGIDSLDERQKRYARNIQKSGRLLLEMINDILDLAKMEAGKMDIRLTEFRLETVVGAQCDMVRSLTEEKNIDLECRVQSDAPPLYQDQGKIQQILTNLLSNAIKFTPEGGRISVSAFRNDRGWLELTVADTGVGIAEADREVIFEKFRQSDRVTGQDGLTREYSGTGLGLSIVKELCKLLGGEITFESDLGKGSTFRIALPWTRPDQPRRDAKLGGTLQQQLSHSSAGRNESQETKLEIRS